jgi:hypothetical protein
VERGWISPEEARINARDVESMPDEALPSEPPKRGFFGR